jgi:hypothetical protein
VVHRLLKNPIESHEYLLLSDSYLSLDTTEISLPEFPWMKLEQGSSDYESLGTINYSYAQLSPLHQTIVEPEVNRSLMTAKPIIVETYIERPRNEVFEIIIDLEQRMKWNNFANRIDFDDKELNQVGTKHVCVFDSQTIEFESVKSDFGESNLVYGEKVLDLPAIARDMTIYFIVGTEGTGSRVQLQIHYVLKPLVAWFIGPIFRRKSLKINKLVLEHLKEYSEQALESLAPNT